MARPLDALDTSVAKIEIVEDVSYCMYVCMYVCVYAYMCSDSAPWLDL